MQDINLSQDTIGEILDKTDDNFDELKDSTDTNAKKIAGLSTRLDNKIAGLSTRLDNLVGNTGDSNSEVVDARVDRFGNIHNTLRNSICFQDKWNLWVSESSLINTRIIVSTDMIQGYNSIEDDNKVTYHPISNCRTLIIDDPQIIDMIKITKKKSSAPALIIEYQDGTVKGFGFGTTTEIIKLYNASKIYFNFFGIDYQDDSIIVYYKNNKVKESINRNNAHHGVFEIKNGKFINQDNLNCNDYMCEVIEDLSNIDSFDFTSKQNSAYVVIFETSEGLFEGFGGLSESYHIIIDHSIYKKAYINLFNTDYLEKVCINYINTRYKLYESGYIKFTVPVRQTKSNNDVSSSSESELSDDSVDVTCILKLPTSYSSDGLPVPLIMVCHGAGKSAVSWSQDTNYNNLVNTFVNAGYAVFDCNGYKEDALGYSFWGDSRGVSAWRKAYQYVTNNYNVEHHFCLYGFSMGGLTALNLAFSNFPNIKCIALGSPVVSLEACYNDSSVKNVIKLLYGMGDTYDQSLSYGCDPYTHILTLNDKKYIFSNLPPLKIWFGGTETGTGTDTGTDLTVSGCVNKNLGKAIVTAINNAGGMAEYREIEGAGHEISYGGNSVANRDFLLYFNRYTKNH